MSLSAEVLEAMARAHDAEQAAHMGEPSPWSFEIKTPSDAAWADERRVAMQCAWDASPGPALLEALRPFAEAAEHLHPALPDDGLTLDCIEVRHWRAAWTAIALATEPTPIPHVSDRLEGRVR